MVRLRLRRKGKRHYPVYDVVALDKRKPRDGAFIERLGYYDPNTTPSKISIDPDRAVYWLNNGAQPSDRVKSLLHAEGILLRRAMAFKDKNQVEIEEAVKEHKERARERYFKSKERRKEKSEQKLKEQEEAKKKEEEQKAEEKTEEKEEEKTEEASAE